MHPTNDISKMVESAMHLQLIGRCGEAAELYQQAVALHQDPTSAILHASIVPPICMSMQELNEWRARLIENLRVLVNRNLKLDITHRLAVPGFLEQYQGLNDRDVQELRAKLYSPPVDPPRRNLRSAAGGKLRLGIISKYFRDHTIGKLSLGLVANLNRDDFHVTVLHVHGNSDDVTGCFRQLADQCIALPDSLPQMRQIIADQDLDILYYTDIGMEPVTYTLAQSRLAHIQCATWGHPVTTGLSTIDYFISSDALETPESSRHYTERLVRLPNLAVYYYRPELPAPGTREQFNLPRDAHAYGCLQSLQKFHPEFDAILAEILRRDPKGILVLLEGSPGEWTQLLQKRFEQTMPDVMNQVRWLPRQNQEGYLQLNQICTVMLDPIHFGGGNTTYESLALGVPVITWPSQLLRGRIAWALYREMNILDCIASNHQHYIELAVRFATDADQRQRIGQQIESGSQLLFENPAGIRQLEEFFRQTIDAKRG